MLPSQHFIIVIVALRRCRRMWRARRVVLTGYKRRKSTHVCAETVGRYGACVYVGVNLGIDGIVDILQANFATISVTLRSRGFRKYHEIRLYSPDDDVIDPWGALINIASVPMHILNIMAIFIPRILLVAPRFPGRGTNCRPAIAGEFGKRMAT
jgi:hypothetical protein